MINIDRKELNRLYEQQGAKFVVYLIGLKLGVLWPKRHRCGSCDEGAGISGEFVPVATCLSPFDSGGKAKK